MDWILNIKYGSTPFELRAELVYESSQIMRIKVHGKSSYLLLETNYPLIRYAPANARKAIQWKLREGGFSAGGLKEAELLHSIMQKLEAVIQKDFPKLY